MINRPLGIESVNPFRLSIAEGLAEGLLYLPEPAIEGAKPPFWNWCKIALIACTALSGITGAALLWLFSLPPVPNCQTLSPLAPDMERLYCVQEATRSGQLPDLVAGLQMLEQWAPDHPLHQEAQRLMADWSGAVLQLADQKVEQNDLRGAIAIAGQIPQSSPVYRQVQAKIGKWQAQWQTAEALQAEAQKAMQAQQWQQATDQIAALRNLSDEHWRSQRANALVQQLLRERSARQTLQEAYKLAQSGTPEQLGLALTRLSQIDPTTYAWEAAQPDLQRWSTILLIFATRQWQVGNLDRAIAVAQQAALNPALERQTRELIWLSHARKLALTSQSNWQATPTQIFQLTGAMAIARQLQPDSPFYAQAQASLRNWQAQLEDLTQLQIAQLTASLGQTVTYRLAVVQANQVAPDRPRPLQAQTLAAHWQEEIERLEDRPYLAAARQQAATGTIPALQAAIAAAQRILPDRALYGEAQTLVLSWQRTIQVLEDQPLLRLARTLAREGNLRQAIEVATNIRLGRPLYLIAQDEMKDWTDQIRRLEAIQAAARLAATIPSQPPVQPNQPQGKPPAPVVPSYQPAPPVVKAAVNPAPKPAPKSRAARPAVAPAPASSAADFVVPTAPTGIGQSAAPEIAAPPVLVAPSPVEELPPAEVLPTTAPSSVGVVAPYVQPTP